MIVDDNRGLSARLVNKKTKKKLREREDDGRKVCATKKMTSFI